MKINTRENPFRHPIPFNVEIETCPHCLGNLDQEYFMGLQIFNFECEACRCQDEDISKYRVDYKYPEHVGDVAGWTQTFSVGGLYVKSDLIAQTSTLYRLVGYLLDDPMEIPFTILGLNNREEILKKFHTYAVFA